MERSDNRTGEAGFTLIELGIVIAVIAVLATVVIMGRGFILASRVTKVVDAMASVRKGGATYAGLTGGAIPTSGGANQILTLGNRQLLPVAVAPWTVVSGFLINQVRFQNTLATGDNSVIIQVTAPTVTQAVDIFTSVNIDPNFINVATTVDGQACTVTTPAVANPFFCFRL